MRGRADLVAIMAMLAVLLWAAVWNGFPLVFPDSGTYLSIAFGQQYAVDRSSFYGLALKPIVTLAKGESLLWAAIGAQAAIVAWSIWTAGRAMAPGRLLWLPPILFLTSAPFHAGQLMPDAFSGAAVLFAWAAASRDPGDDGAPLLWLAGFGCALVHYTHLALFVVAGAATILAGLELGLAWRAAARRLLALLLVAAAVVGAHVAANGAVLQRWSMSPMGGVFLFARLHEDGPAARWLARHCGHDAPARLCAVRTALPRDSQVLLWNNERSPLADRLWHAPAAERWAWVDMLGAAARGAIRDEPGAVLLAAARGGRDQFLHFAVLDDECPVGCRDPRAGITSAIRHFRPAAEPSLMASRQVEDRTRKPLLRAVTAPIAWAAILLIPVAALLAWQRRDQLSLGLLMAIGSTLVVNAALAGALSDVHDRYQSRLVWLAPLGLALVALRSAQTFSRWRISLPGLK